jgi:hypothetical protein
MKELHQSMEPAAAAPSKAETARTPSVPNPPVTRRQDPRPLPFARGASSQQQHRSRLISLPQSILAEAADLREKFGIGPHIPESHDSKLGQLIIRPASTDAAPPSMAALMALPTQEDGLQVVDEPLSRSREHYRALVLQQSKEAEKYQSPTLFAESLVRQVFNDPNADPIVRAATASWALQVLGTSMPLLNVLRDALLPFLHVDFNSHGSPGPVDLLRFDPLTLQRHPFLTHDFFAPRYYRLKLSEAKLLSQSQTHQLALKGRKAAASHLVGRWIGAVVRVCFVSWRKYTRKEKVDRFRRRLLAKHGERDLRLLLLASAFNRWRFGVEVQRTEYLEEKTNTLVHQMDTAKNQFQLQCFRSDKYLRSVEELREEVNRLRDVETRLREDVRRLERLLREHEKDSQASLNSHVNEVLQVLSQWRTFARLLVDQRSARVQAVEISAPGKSSSSDSDDDEGPDPSRTLSSGRLDRRPSLRNSLGGLSTEQFLLQWCTAIVRQSVVSHITAVRNFTTDFQSGEVLLLVMHHVFPSQVPFSPLQETNLGKRYDLLIDLAKKLGLSYLVQANDIREGTGDIMVLTVTELFLRHASKKRADAEVQGNESELPVVKYDAAMMEHVISESRKEMSKLRMEGASLESLEKRQAQVEEALVSQASYFARHRHLGNPVEIMDPKDLGRYTKFNPARFQDIAFKYARCQDPGAVDRWVPFDEQLKLLRKELKGHFATIRRVFKFYAENSPTMTDVAFWRFCGDIRVMDKVVTRVQVDRIFQVANSEDIPRAVEGGLDESQIGAASDGDAEDEEENPTTELIPSEFVECLIRMADIRVKEGGRMLQERFDLFMQNYVLPFACKSEADKFKKEVYESGTQAALHRYQKDLQKIFLHYGTGKGSRKTLNSERFSEFAKDAHLQLDEGTQATIFQNVLGVGAEEMAQHEFLEAIVSVAAFKVPSPFIGLDRKIDVVVSSMISTLRAKLRTRGVQLSDVKPILADGGSHGKAK